MNASLMIVRQVNNNAGIQTDSVIIAISSCLVFELKSHKFTQVIKTCYADGKVLNMGVIESRPVCPSKINWSQ